ncbi:hypothetical protein KAS08_01865 [Candidatus Pacearchaeota archaeon]|nr:hypothetical protein [Candidatus Pacearchaeota archaeon]
MKKIFRKAITVLGSAALIGATVGAAAAAAYPAQFTASNTVIVYGSDSGAADNIATTALNADLLSLAAGSTTTTTVEGGEVFSLGKDSDEFEFGYNLSSVFTSLDDGEMESFLADGEYDDGVIDSEFSQEITLGTQALSLFADTDYDDDKTPTIGFHFDDTEVLSYEMTLDDSDEVYVNMIDTEIPLMGREYYVLDATADEVTLLDSAEKVVVTEGETITVDGKTISISVAAETYVRFVVNGEMTDKLHDSGTDYDLYQELDDGSYIVVSSNDYNAKDSGISSAEISIGKGKLTLSNDGGEVEINDETVTGLTSYVYSTGTTPVNAVGTEVIKSIKLTWTTDDEEFLVEGGAMVMPGFETIKVLFGGMNFPEDSEKISIDNGETVTLNMENFDVDLMYATTEANGVQGDDGNLLHIDATPSSTKTYFLKDGDRFLATDLDETLSEVEQLYYEVTTLRNDSNGFDLVLNDLTDADKDIPFDDDEADETDTSRGDVEVKLNLVYEDGVNVTDADAALIDAAGLSTALLTSYPSDNSTLVEIAKVTVTQDDSIDLHFDKVVSDTGMIVEIPVAADVADNDDLLIFYEAKDDGDLETTFSSATADIYADLDWDTSDEYVYANENSTAITFKEESDNNYIGYVESDLTSMVSYDTDAHSYEITYFGEEVVADVSIASADAVLSTSTESGNLIVLDTDADKLVGKNLIVVGGSAINRVAADLLSLNYPSYGADFTEKTGIADGQALIEVFPYSGNTAILVAGYTAADTAKATTYLLHESEDFDLVEGAKLKVTSATEATVVTTA